MNEENEMRKESINQGKPNTPTRGQERRKVFHMVDVREPRLSIATINTVLSYNRTRTPTIY